VLIELTPQELYLSSVVGVRRRIESMRRGCSERNGLDREKVASAWYYNLVGAMGEVAAARALNVYWPATINQRKDEPDLLPDYQVRCLAESHYDLTVRDDDLDRFRYVLVTGDPPVFEVHGWIIGGEAKRPEWYRDRGDRNAPAYWVPQSALEPI
jgi:hypothetical protein